MSAMRVIITTRAMNFTMAMSFTTATKVMMGKMVTMIMVKIKTAIIKTVT